MFITLHIITAKNKHIYKITIVQLSMQYPHFVGPVQQAYTTLHVPNIWSVRNCQSRITLSQLK